MELGDNSEKRVSLVIVVKLTQNIGILKDKYLLSSHFKWVLLDFRNALRLFTSANKNHIL